MYKRTRPKILACLLFALSAAGCVHIPQYDQLTKVIAEKPIDKQAEVIIWQLDVINENSAYDKHKNTYNSLIINDAVRIFKQGGFNDYQQHLIQKLAITNTKENLPKTLTALLDAGMPAQWISTKHAVLDDNEADILYLINRGLSPDRGYGWSPLIAAIREDKPKTALLLLNHGFDPNKPYYKTVEGEQPQDWQKEPLFYHAVRYSRDTVVKAVFKFGTTADLNIAYSIARPGNRWMLISLGANASGQTRKESGYLAFKHGMIDSYLDFLAEGNEPLCDYTPSYPEQVAAMASTCKDTKQLQSKLDHALVLATATPYNKRFKRDSEKYTSEQGVQDLIKELLLAGANPNAKTYGYNCHTQIDNRSDPLSCSISNLHSNINPETIQRLLIAGARPNRIYQCGTPLIGLSPDYCSALDYVDSRIEGAKEADNDKLLRKARQARNYLVKAGARNHTTSSNSDFFDIAMKSLVSAGIGATVAGSGLDAGSSSQVMASAMSDIWSSGEGNSLALLSQQYATGQIKVNNPNIDSLMKDKRRFDQQVASISKESSGEINNSKKSSREDKCTDTTVCKGTRYSGPYEFTARFVSRAWRETANLSCKEVRSQWGQGEYNAQCQMEGNRRSSSSTTVFRAAGVAYSDCRREENSWRNKWYASEVTVYCEKLPSSKNKKAGVKAQ